MVLKMFVYWLVFIQAFKHIAILFYYNCPFFILTLPNERNNNFKTSCFEIKIEFKNV